MRHGSRVRGKNIAASVLLNNKRHNPRFSILVSKKVSKKAVVRNRIRRRIFEAIGEYDLEGMQPFDVVVSVFDSSYKDMSWADLRANVKDILTKAKII